MPRVQRRRHRRAEVDVTQAQHQVFGVENDPVHIVHCGQTVDPPDEFDVPRTPRCVVPNPGHVPLDRLPGSRIVPRQRKPHTPAGHDQVGRPGQIPLEFAHQAQCLADRQRVRIHMYLQRPDARRQVDDPGHALGGQPLGERVHPHPQRQIELHLAVLDEQVVVAAAAVGHRWLTVHSGLSAEHATVVQHRPARLDGHRWCPP